MALEIKYVTCGKYLVVHRTHLLKYSDCQEILFLPFLPSFLLAGLAWSNGDRKSMYLWIPLWCIAISSPTTIHPSIQCCDWYKLFRASVSQPVRCRTCSAMDGSLFLISRADIFSIYPKIFKELLASDDADRQVTPSGRLPKDIFNVPSDYEWKLKVYFRLLEMQRKLNEAEERGE